ncbi:MAG: hypothetical protein JWQ04_1672 [Pedosphaera sp.]|nr:hypothetical protein [Pedosphaera sp.]
MIASAVVLLAGCATDRDNTGGTGNERETGTAAGPYDNAQNPPRRLQGPNGSIGPGNPFGLGPGGVARPYPY